MKASLENLKILKEAMVRAASHYTAYGHYDPSLSRLDGHCGAAAFTVQKILGGDLVGGKIEGERHIWNRLPDGTEIDMTACQYGGVGFSPMTKGKTLPKRRTSNAKHELFYSLTIGEMKK